MNSNVISPPLQNITNTNVTNLAAEFKNVESIRTAWYTLMIIGGQVFLPIILLTMILSKNVRRGPFLINYIVISIELSIFSCLLLYAGVSRGPEPPFGICLAQASFIYGSFPAINLSGALVVHQVWRSLRAVTFGRELEEERMSRLRTVSTIVAPHAVMLIFMIAAIVDGKAHPKLVTRDRDIFYCSIASNIGIASELLSQLFSIITVVLVVRTLFILYSKWGSNLKEINLPNTTLAFNIRLIKRIFVLTILTLLEFMCAFFQEVNPMIGLIFTFSFSLIPLGVALVFGTQPSILRVWCFWKPRKPRAELDSYATTFTMVDYGRQRSGTLLSTDIKIDVERFVV